jgi:2-haloacid dehalogenase
VAGEPASCDTVVFDLGGVLIEWDPRLLYRTLLPEHEIEPFLAEVEFFEWNTRLDAGATFAETLEAHVARFPHRRQLLEAYQLRFAETVAGEIGGTVDVLRELRDGGVRLLALTNWHAETFEATRHRFHFLEWFEDVVVSGQERLVKPDPRIFRLVIERYGLQPGRTAYVDDVAANVAAAADAGLRPVLFTDPVRLRADLAALGLRTLASG